MLSLGNLCFPVAKFLLRLFRLGPIKEQEELNYRIKHIRWAWSRWRGFFRNVDPEEETLRVRSARIHYTSYEFGLCARKKEIAVNQAMSSVCLSRNNHDSLGANFSRSNDSVASAYALAARQKEFNRVHLASGSTSLLCPFLCASLNFVISDCSLDEGSSQVRGDARRHSKSTANRLADGSAPTRVSRTRVHGIWGFLIANRFPAADVACVERPTGDFVTFGHNFAATAISLSLRTAQPLH